MLHQFSYLNSFLPFLDWILVLLLKYIRFPNVWVPKDLQNKTTHMHNFRSLYLKPHNLQELDWMENELRKLPQHPLVLHIHKPKKYRYFQFRLLPSSNKCIKINTGQQIDTLYTLTSPVCHPWSGSGFESTLWTLMDPSSWK